MKNIINIQPSPEEVFNTAIKLQESAIYFSETSKSAIDIIKKMHLEKVEKSSENFNTFVTCIQNLEKLLKPLSSNGFLEEFQVDYFVKELSTLMISIIKDYKTFDPEFSLFFNPTNQILYSDYQKIVGGLVGLKSEQKQEKIDGVVEYMQTIGAPGSNGARTPSEFIQYMMDPSQSCLFQNLPNSDKYRLSHRDYEKEQQPFSNFNDEILFYHGKMKEKTEPITIMEILNDNSELFKRLYLVLTSIDYPSVEIIKGAAFYKPYEIVTLQNGESLHDVIPHPLIANSSQIALGPGDRTIIAYEIAEGMAYLHLKRIIHRNLNSSNIMIDENKNPQIVNFANSCNLPDNTNSLTKPQYSKSSFIAPELLTEECTYNESIDVFSFAGILYELLTGDAPFAKDPNIKQRIFNRDRPPIPDSCPSDLKELIEQCWNQDSKQRPTFLDILDKMLETKIKFPNDETIQKVDDFYNKKHRKPEELRNCLVLLKTIFKDINNSFVCTQQLIRARSILYSYYILLKTNDLEKILELDPKVKKGLGSLYNSLEELSNIIESTFQAQWLSNALTLSAIAPTTQIYDAMTKIYNVMINQLEFNDICKYEYVANDLLYDFRYMNAIYKGSIDRYPGLKKQIQEIDDFLKSKGINNDYTKPVTEGVSVVLQQYKDYRVERSNYEIQNRIGSGYSAEVFKAKQLQPEKFVALKIFNMNYLADAQADILKRELAFLISLKNDSSKYIVSFIGYNADPGEPLWVITDLYEGGDLFKAKDKLTPFQKTKIMFEIAEGMEYLHSKNILHRDLKTSNVLLDGDTPKITDFGYARTDIGLNMTPKRGTYCYMAPEIIKGDPYSFAADVCSFGRMLWELYSNEIPWYWNRQRNTFYKESEVYDLITGGHRLPFPYSISKNLKRLIDDACSFEQEDRPSFTNIIERMIEEKISFPPEKDIQEYNAKIEDFYSKKSSERNSNNNQQLQGSE